MKKENPKVTIKELNAKYWANLHLKPQKDQEKEITERFKLLQSKHK